MGGAIANLFASLTYSRYCETELLRGLSRDDVRLDLSAAPKDPERHTSSLTL